MWRVYHAHMTNLARVKVSWEGWDGGPGVNVLHFSQGFTATGWDGSIVTSLLDEIGAAYAGLGDVMHTGVSCTIPDQAEIIDGGTGQLVDIIPRTSGQSEKVIGRATVAMPPNIMLLFRLKGDNFRNGRLTQGRIYIGPLATTAAQDDGNVKTSVAQGLPANWAALLSGPGPRLAIYHRPTKTAPSSGDWTDVATVTVWHKFAQLSSRRD
jgi:hypothetical protein